MNSAGGRVCDGDDMAAATGGQRERRRDKDGRAGQHPHVTTTYDGALSFVTFVPGQAGSFRNTCRVRLCPLVSGTDETPNRVVEAVRDAVTSDPESVELRAHLAALLLEEGDASGSRREAALFRNQTA